ncbi:MAG TPA: hypothetical protein VK528_02500 [Flavobacterium sp.]|nr:hypothetical protein [Flavobacterium sp.]
MKNSNNALPDDINRIGMPALSPIEERILNIYWLKKELEEFLPQIASYAMPQEIAAIALSQLAIMEKLLVLSLYEQYKIDNDPDNED